MIRYIVADLIGKPNVSALFFFRPYNLQVISRSGVCADYYIFSPTTVIHLQDGCSIELWTLAEWYREAVLCEAVREIPFFRDYLLRKIFKR